MNIPSEFFKHAAETLYILLFTKSYTFLVQIVFTFYIKDVQKFSCPFIVQGLNTVIVFNI